MGAEERDKTEELPLLVEEAGKNGNFLTGKVAYLPKPEEAHGKPQTSKKLRIIKRVKMANKLEKGKHDLNKQAKHDQKDDSPQELT